MKLRLTSLGRRGSPAPPSPRPLVLHEAPDRGHLAGPAAIDDAGRVDADALGPADFGRGLGYEGQDLAVLDAADADALLEAGIALRVRLRIRDIDHVVLVDRDVARAAELLPFGDELAVAFEHFDAVVDAVGDIDPPGGIEGDAVRRVELARSVAVLAPSGDEL